MKKKQKSREIAIQESSLGQVKSMKTSSLSLWSGYWEVYSLFRKKKVIQEEWTHSLEFNHNYSFIIVNELIFFSFLIDFCASPKDYPY